MADFAESVLKLVAEPDYKPITLKAMSRRFEVSPDDYAEFRATVKRLIKEGKLDLAKDKTLRRPDQAGLIVGLFRRSAKGFGFVRPHDVGREDRPDLHSGRGHARRLQRRRGRRQDHQAVPACGDERSKDGSSEVLTRASGVFVGNLLRGGRHQLRPDRRHDVPRADLRGRPRGQRGQAGRQGRARDRPLPDAVPRRRRGHHRDPRPARAAGGRHA